MPAPTGGGTHPVNPCQQREYQRTSDHCAGLIQARPCALLPPSCVNGDKRRHAAWQAAAILLDRGWGKAPQPHTGEDDKDIRVTIRTIIEGKE